MRSRVVTLLTCLIGCCITREGWAQQRVVVVLDDSGSMSERMADRTMKMEAAKQALLAVLGGLSADAEVGVLAINTQTNEGNWVVPFGPVDKAVYVPRISGIRANGGTPRGAALKVAADQLLQERRKKIYGTYRLLIVTDGEASDQFLLDSYLPDIKSRGLVLDVIGVDMQGDHSLATAVQTYRRADDPASLQQAVAEVFAESGGDGAGQDTAESDFEWLAGLPDEVAASALTALANGNTNNEPIEAGKSLESNGGNSGPNGAPPTRSPQSRPASKDVSLLANCFGCFVVLVLGVGVIVFLSVVMRRR